MVNNKGKKSKHSFWRIWHRWVGFVFAIFIILFCVSGIVLNHRQCFTSCEVSRGWLPKAYQIDHWNQGIIKGTLAVGDEVWGYGQAGIWRTDRTFSRWEEQNEGLAAGIDNRKISNLVRTRDGQLWCAALYEAYRHDTIASCWQSIALPNNKERISDIALRGGDTLIVLTRSTLYEATAPEYRFTERPLQTVESYDAKVTLFKTIWMLHSGELFGLPGRLVVDSLGIVLIVLCVTGIVFFVLPYRLRRVRQIEQKRTIGQWMKWNLTWHNRLGSSLIVLTLILSITGMCLRPPLMIPLAMTRTKPLPFSALDQKNVMHDKLRGIRWEARHQTWILSTSEGFFWLDQTLDTGHLWPIAKQAAPPVSPMGITVFRQHQGEWLVGSMSGLYRWQPTTGSVTDWFTGLPYVGKKGYPVADHAVTGFSIDYEQGPVIFEYSAAPNVTLPAMPDVLKEQPMSLWNFALELHVGRCYEPFLGSMFSVLFVFIAGLVLTLTLISGYIDYRRSNRKVKSEELLTK